MKYPKINNTMSHLVKRVGRQGGGGGLKNENSK